MVNYVCSHCYIRQAKNTALLSAAENGYDEIVESLLQYDNINVHVQNNVCTQKITLVSSIWFFKCKNFNPFRFLI